MDNSLENLPGFKEDQLNKLGPCAVCGKTQLASDKSSISFYRVTIEQAGFMPDAIRRQVGLGLTLGGHAALARIMGPDEDLAKVLAGPKQVFVHEACAGDIGHLLMLMGKET